MYVLVARFPVMRSVSSNCASPPSCRLLLQKPNKPSTSFLVKRQYRTSVEYRYPNARTCPGRAYCKCERRAVGRGGAREDWSLVHRQFRPFGQGLERR